MTTQLPHWRIFQRLDTARGDTTYRWVAEQAYSNDGPGGYFSEATRERVLEEARAYEKRWPPNAPDRIEEVPLFVDREGT